MISAREGTLDRRLRLSETTAYGTMAAAALLALWAFASPGAASRTVTLAAVAALLPAIALGAWAVHQRRTQRDTMANSAAMFRRLLADSPDSVLMLSQGRIVFANLAATRFFDESEENLLGRDVLEVVHPDDHQLVRDRTALVERDMQTTVPAAIRYLRRDGRTIEAEGRGGPIVLDGRPAIQVVLRDLSARRDAEERLRVSEMRYRMLADHSADLISRRSADHRFEYASPSYASVLGYEPDELIGRDCIDFMHPDDLDRVRSMRAGHADAASHMRITARMRHKGGHYIWLESVASALQTEAGAHEGFIVSARDVTVRITLEEELRQAQKMEVLGRMASGVAHDFNNLLTIIRSSAELMRMDRSTAGAPPELVDDIEMATDRAAALTSHLLTFSGRMQHAPVLIQPAPVIHGVTPILRRLVSGNVGVDVRLGAGVDDAWIMADVVRFEQVLVNLVGNARDAMPSGGTVQVECDTVTLRGSTSHRFGVIAPGRYLTLSVEDGGTGMTEEVQEHLFNPFYTTKPPGRGTGLGLSIVHGVVQEALGTITVSSEIGSGSRFTVYWPMAEAPVSAEALAVATAQSVRRPTPLSMPTIAAETAPPPSTSVSEKAVEADSRGLVLLVDDDSSVRRVVARQLESCGYRVRMADSGLAALAILRRDSAAISAVVTDVRMPGMGGIELVQTMLAEQIRCPALIVSGHMDVPLPPAWPEGAQVSFLPKPISGVALRRTLGDMLAPAPMPPAATV